MDMCYFGQVLLDLNIISTSQSVFVSLLCYCTTEVPLARGTVQLWSWYV